MKKSTIKPCGLPIPQIRLIAEQSSALLGYSPSADLAALVKKMNGRIKRISKQNDATDNPSSIEVNSDGSFVIQLSPWLFPLQERIAIAHELGHYVLHARAGRVPLTAHFTPDAEDETAEFEAQEFAAAFLVPLEMLRKAINEEMGKDALSVAAHFMVPVPVAAARMKQLGA